MLKTGAFTVSCCYAAPPQRPRLPARPAFEVDIADAVDVALGRARHHPGGGVVARAWVKMGEINSG